MKIINVNEFNFEQVADPVATESSVYKGLLENQKHLPSDLNYVCLPIADLINTKGLQYTQFVIDQIEKQVPESKIYVCQHIWVKNLNFYNNTVYTPHSLIDDDLHVIPHYNPCIDRDDYIPLENRVYDYTFIGAYKTHKLRPQLATLHNDSNIIVEDTGDWHFYKDNNSRDEFKLKYKNTLLNSRVALCPPGTGVSTIRLYEAMAGGVVPVVFNSVKVPGSVKDHIIRIDNVNNIHDIDLESNSLADKSAELHSIYWSDLCNDRLFSFVI